MPPLKTYIDLHCERTQDGLFEEPLNTVTSLLFIVAAYLLHNEFKKTEQKIFSIRFMIIMIVLIGIGSTIFHMSGRIWGALADVIPISVFAVVFIYNFTRHVLGQGVLISLLSFSLFAGGNLIFKSFIGRAPDGYFSLIPSIVIMFLLAIYMLWAKNPSARNFLIASFIAAIAISARTLDTFMNRAGSCEQLPISLHFLWHSFMAIYIWIVMRELILRQRANYPS